jgi:hypothetical protein
VDLGNLDAGMQERWKEMNLGTFDKGWTGRQVQDKQELGRDATTMGDGHNSESCEQYEPLNAANFIAETFLYNWDIRSLHLQFPPLLESTRLTRALPSRSVTA